MGERIVVGDDHDLIECAVLFTDIEGSTPRWEAEPEVMRSLIRIHDDLLTDVVERGGGVVVKRTGDGLVARFDDVDDAVHCAIELQRSLPTAFADHVPLAVRIGIHAGVFEPRLGDLHGPAMNRGARLMSAAAGGQVLVSELVRSRCVRHGRFRPLGVHRLKGLQQPETVHQVLAEGLADDFPPIRSLNTTLGNLPLAPPEMVNRVSEIASVTATLPTARLMTLVGPGGVGKTRLAVHCGQLVRPSFPDGVWMIDLASVHEPGRVAATALTALGIGREATDDPTELVAATWRSKSMLVVLDNCEHVLDEVVSLVRSAVSDVSTVTLLATSQRRLGVTGEQVVRVDPLEVPDESDLTGADEPVPAVQLFAQRAQAANPDFRLDDSNRAIVHTICRELDGLPLAIELAASRCEVLEPDQIAARLDQRFSLLRDRHEIDRHRTLQAAIGWSYDLAGDDERSLLRAVSVFRSPFTVEAAAAVAGARTDIDLDDVIDALGDLVDRSLLARSGRSFRLLDSVRRFAYDALVAAGDESAVLDRHARWMMAAAAGAVDDPDIAVVRAWLTDLTAREEDLRLALSTLVHTDPSDAALMAMSLIDFWITRNEFQQGLEWFRACEAGVDDPFLRLRLLGWLASFGWAAGDNDSSAAWAEAAIELAASIGAPYPSVAATRLSIHRLFAGETHEAVVIAERVMAVVDDEPEIARLLGVLAVSIAAGGDIARAVSIADRGIEVARRVGVLRTTTSLLNRLMVTPGDPSTVALADEAGRLCELIGRREGQTHVLMAKANVLRTQGDDEGFIDTIVRACEIGAAVQESPQVVNTLDQLPGVLHRRHPRETVALITSIERAHHAFGQVGYDRDLRRRQRLAVELRELLGDDEYERWAEMGRRRTLAACIDRLRWRVDEDRRLATDQTADHTADQTSSSVSSM